MTAEARNIIAGIEAAKILNVHFDTVKMWAEMGKVLRHTLAGALVFDREVSEEQNLHLYPLEPLANGPSFDSTPGGRTGDWPTPAPPAG